jgi:hypothetical protein
MRQPTQDGKKIAVPASGSILVIDHALTLVDRLFAILLDAGDGA